MIYIFKYLELGVFGLLIIALLFSIILISNFFIGYNKKNQIPKSDKKCRFAIIIPARDESKVIEANLTSIVNSNYPIELLDIYLIVEDNNDPTISISKKFPNTHIFIRKNLNNVGKGYALDECLNYIYSSEDMYDAFIILDADNIISKEFISRLNDAYQYGFDIGVGNRDNKDWNASTIGASSALTFTIINTLQNKPKSNLGMNVTISGTGFFIRTDVLRKFNGWPFHTLTEDYELTNYSIINGLNSVYIEDAIYYDEQPNKMHQSIVQRTRWIKGYFKVRHIYKKQKINTLKENKKTKNSISQFIGAIPGLLIGLDLLYYLTICIIFACIAKKDGLDPTPYIVKIICLFTVLYLIALILTVFVLILNKKQIKIKKWNLIKLIFFHPIFLFTYVFAAIRAIFTKSRWDKIEHTINTNL